MTNHDLEDDPHGLRERTVEDALAHVDPHEKEENLRFLYHEKGRTQREIADFYGVDQSTISKAMDRVGIEARPPICERHSPLESIGAD